MIATVGIQIADKEENKTKKIMMQILNIVIIIFLIVNLAIAVDIPYSDLFREKFLTFSDLYTAFHSKTLSISTILPYLITSAIMLISLIISVYISKKEKNILQVVLLIAGLFTQGIMVMAPYSPLRTTFTTIIFFIITIGYTCYISLKNDYSILLAFVIPLTIFNSYLGIIATIVFIGINSLNIKESKNNKIIITVLIIFGISSMFNWCQTYIGYKKNKRIYNENITRIENFLREYPTKDKQDCKELYLLPPDDDKYGFTAMAGIDWIDEAIKAYFNISNSVKLINDVKKNI